jgi:HPt (histidine-containing phosphotransfer) domain-containing protein
MDFAAALKRYGAEPMYIRILRSFLTHTPELLDRLRSPTRKTLPDYAISVHGLKGACYGVCAEALGRAAAELEFAAKAGDFEQVESKNSLFIARVETTLEDLAKLLQS